jgi:hypothetical protein
MPLMGFKSEIPVVQHRVYLWVTLLSETVETKCIKCICSHREDCMHPVSNLNQLWCLNTLKVTGHVRTVD